jgi:hypothetical protein
MTGSRHARWRPDEHIVPVNFYLEHWQRIARRTLFYCSGCTVEPRPVPGALDGSVWKNVAEGHFEVLVGAIVGDCGHATMASNQAESPTVGFHNGQHSLGGNLVHGCYHLERALSGHYVDYPDKFT